MQAVDERGLGHGGHVRVQREQAAEPDGDAEPVVVRGRRRRTGRGGRQPGEDDREQQGVDHSVAPAGRGPDRGGAQAAVQEEGEARQGRQARGAARDQGVGVVEVLADVEAVGQRLGDQEPGHVAGDHEQQAVVEERARDPQQPALVQLTGPGGEAETVVAVAPGRPRHQHHQGQVRQDAPQGGVQVPHRRAPSSCGRGWAGKGPRTSRPTASVGGPVRVRRRASSRLAGARPGRHRPTAWRRAA